MVTNAALMATKGFFIVTVEKKNLKLGFLN